MTNTGKKPMPDEEVIKRGWKNLRVSASASFSESDVSALAQVLTALQSGADVRLMAKAPALVSVAKKIPTMKKAIERQKLRRAMKAR